MGKEKLKDVIKRNKQDIMFYIIIIAVVFVTAQLEREQGKIEVCYNMGEFYKYGKCYTCEELGGEYVNNDNNCIINEQRLKWLNITI
jgi:hypothetical protein